MKFLLLITVIVIGNPSPFEPMVRSTLIDTGEYYESYSECYKESIGRKSSYPIITPLNRVMMIQTECQEVEEK